MLIHLERRGECVLEYDNSKRFGSASQADQSPFKDKLINVCASGFHCT